MTTAIDRAGSGDIHREPGEATENIGHILLRQGEVYNRNRLAAAHTMIVRTDLTADPEQVAAAQLRADEPFILDMRAASPRDAWISTGEIPPFLSYALTFTGTGLQDPPTGNPPPLPPLPPTPAKAEDEDERPPRYRGDRRRPAPRWAGYAIAVGASAPFWALATLGVLAVIR